MLRIIAIIFLSLFCLKSQAQDLKTIDKLPLIEISISANYLETPNQYSLRFTTYTIELENTSNESIYILGQEQKYLYDSNIVLKGNCLDKYYFNEDKINLLVLEKGKKIKTTLFFEATHLDSISKAGGILEGEQRYLYRKMSSFKIDTLKIKFAFKLKVDDKFSMKTFSTFNDQNIESRLYGFEEYYKVGIIANNSKDTIMIDSITYKIAGINFSDVYLTRAFLGNKLKLPIQLLPNASFKIEQYYYDKKFETSKMILFVHCSKFSNNEQIVLIDSLIHPLTPNLQKRINLYPNLQTINYIKDITLKNLSFPFSSLDTNLSIVDFELIAENPKDQYKLKAEGNVLPMDLSLDTTYSNKIQGISFICDEIGTFRNLVKVKYQNRKTKEEEYESVMFTVRVKETADIEIYQEQSNNLMFYPNPCNNFLNFKNDAISEIEIFDINGTKMMSFDKIKAPIDLSNMSKGSYMIKYKLNNQNFIDKIIKE